MKKYIALALVLFGLSAGLVAAESNEDSTRLALIAIIENLKAQILELQERLANNPTGTTTAVTPAWCYNFKRDLKIGDYTSERDGNGDTKYLQQILVAEGFAIDPLEYNARWVAKFGSSTASAVTRFQEKYADEILKPLGLTRGTGYVGRSTRAVLNRLCKGNNQAPIIHNFSGPTQLAVGEEGTWTVRATDPDNSSLTYNISWGDEGQTSPSATSLDRGTSPVQQTATFTHTYTKAGNYAPSVIVTDSTGLTTRKNLSVVVGTSQSALLKVTKPNGGERWEAGAVERISWRLTQATRSAKVNLYLDPEPPVCVNDPVTPCLVLMVPPYTLDKNIDWDARYNWIVATDIDNKDIPAGTYRVRVCLASNTTNCDASDRPFTIVDDTRTNLPPTIGLVTGPTVLSLREVGEWEVRAKDPENGPLMYSIDWGDQVGSGADASLSNELPRNSSFQQSASFTHRYRARGTYKVTILVKDDKAQTAKTTLTVDVQ